MDITPTTVSPTACRTWRRTGVDAGRLGPDGRRVLDRPVLGAVTSIRDMAGMVGDPHTDSAGSHPSRMTSSRSATAA
jgi:hypothetical protein